MSKDEKNALAKIDEMIAILGLSDNEQTMFEIAPTSDENEKILSLKSGSWDGIQPWLCVDENQNLHSIISAKSLSALIVAYRNTLRENFDLRLEKSIWQNVPADFADVWAVAMDELKKVTKNKSMHSVDVDVERLVKNIKKKHPNLFINVKEIIQKAKGKAND